jgi:flagellar protein FliS
MNKEVTLENVELSDIHGRPQLITLLLYKKLLKKLEHAIDSINERNYEEANKSLQLCADIITRLGFGLKYEAGVLADQLELLYHYMFDTVYKANIQKNKKLLYEVRHIVSELDEAWTQAMKQEGTTEISAGAAGKSSVVSKKVSQFNPYQRREIEQEVYQYEKDKQEIHLKK